MRFIDLMGVALAVIFGVLLAIFLSRCTPLPTPLPVPPDPIPQGGAGPVLTDCERAGERLEELGCRDKSGAPLWQTPEGKPFAEACDYSASMGRDWKPECLATIHDCGEIDAAMRGLVCR
jgi:hypothetical protein